VLEVIDGESEKGLPVRDGGLGWHSARPDEMYGCAFPVDSRRALLFEVGDEDEAVVRSAVSAIPCLES
jgi:hypothetical protein